VGVALADLKFGVYDSYQKHKAKGTKRTTNEDLETHLSDYP